MLEVATRIFARKGFSAATTAAIAEAAGVTEPILYRHFHSKQDLFIAIVRRMSEQTIQRWQASIADIDDPVERIRAIGSQFPDEIRHLRNAYQVLHGALVTSSESKVQAVMRQHYRRAHDFFADIVRDGQAQGLFRADMRPDVAAWEFIYIGIGYAMITHNLNTFDGVDVEALIDSILRGLQR